MHPDIFFINISLCEGALESFEKENITFSPLLMHTFLSVLAQDQTYYYRNSFASTLRIYNNHEYVKNFTEIISSLHLLNNENFLITSKFFLGNNYKLQDDFKNIINNFHYEIEAVDFSKKETAAKLIDSWLENKTSGLLRNLISCHNLSETTRLALLNTVHFKGKWDSTFNLEPSSRMFYLNEKDTIEAQMFTMTGEVYYTFGKYLSAIELPIISEDFSLILFLPKKEHNIQDTSNLRYFERLIEQLTKGHVEVSLPKFKIEQLLDCRTIFANLNLKEEFQDNVNFFDMLQSDDFLKFAQIDEKGLITVDEKGAEAASGFVVTMVPAELDKGVTSPDGIKMSEMTIKTVISNRFAKTLITCKVQNTDQIAKEATFTVILPETAFITKFVMEMNGKSYESYIKRVEEAKAIYDKALAQGRGAGIVQADTRDSTQFNVSVNLEPQSVAVFRLTYEEMLLRIHDQYELVLNICPRQIVDNLNVEVTINESRPLKFVKTPPLRSGKEVNQKVEANLVPSSDIKITNSNAVVKFSADVKQQQKISSYLGNPISEGFGGQFVVQYDVERDPKDGEILLQDGYFVHFFAPNDLDPLPKHVVFVLDTSSSMEGRKIDQLKDAMMSILSDIRKGDLISIIEFNSNVVVWDINAKECKIVSCEDFKNFEEPFGTLGELSLPTPTLANEITINKAKNIVENLPGGRLTFMIGGLEMALYMIKIGQDKIIDKSSKYQPIMVFLTDGQPNVGYDSSSQIIHTVTTLNLKHNNVPIFSLSFGEGADKSFLRELSLRNFGFSRHIYEASDASLQLQSFYKQISSPLLANIKFKYESDVTEVTRSHFPIYFRGGELVVSGRCEDCQLPCVINGCGPSGYLNLRSIVKNPVTSLERLWAYLTVKQLLEEKNIVDNKEELTKRAIDLAFEYSFVTEVTSLVVVKPNEVYDAQLDYGKPKTRIIRNRMIKHTPNDLKLVSDREPLTRTFKKLVIRVKENEPVPETRIIIKQKGGCVEEILVEFVKDDSELLSEEPKKMEFLADRPFVVALTLKRGGKRIILFMGYVHKPS